MLQRKAVGILAIFAMSLGWGGYTKAAQDKTDDEVSIDVAALVKAGKAAWDLVGKPIMSSFTEHRRITPVKEVFDGRDHWVMYVPMIDHESRCSLNWSKDVFQGNRGRVRIELVNVPPESRARVWVQGKGDKSKSRDRDRESVFSLVEPIGLDWGPGHKDDRAFYFAEREGFDAGQFLKEFPAAAFKITVLNPRP